MRMQIGTGSRAGTCVLFNTLGIDLDGLKQKIGVTVCCMCLDSCRCVARLVAMICVQGT